MIFKASSNANLFMMIIIQLLKQIKSESDKGTCLNHTSHRQLFISDISKLGRIEFAIMLIILFQMDLVFNSDISFCGSHFCRLVAWSSGIGEALLTFFHVQWICIGLNPHVVLGSSSLLSHVPTCQVHSHCIWLQPSFPTGFLQIPLSMVRCTSIRNLDAGFLFHGNMGNGCT